MVFLIKCYSNAAYSPSPSSSKKLYCGDQNFKRKNKKWPVAGFFFFYPITFSHDNYSRKVNVYKSGALSQISKL